MAVSRFLNDWEIGEYEELLRILSGVSVNGSKDIPCWSLTPNGSFSVSPFIKNCLSSEMMASVSQLSRFGGSRFHPEFLSWEACRECFLTIDNLRRRGKFLVNDCFLCKNDDSTCRYVLLHCLVVYKLWQIVYGLLGLNWVLAGSVREALWAWKGIRGRNSQLAMVPLTISWAVWEREKQEGF